MNTSVIILNYNTGELLEKCISSVFKSIGNEDEVILVDNASSDDIHLKCKEKFPDINLIENSTNLGYAEGNNVGIRSAKGEFIAILNPDIKVEPNWLRELQKAFLENGEGLYQPKTLNYNNKAKILSTGNCYDLFGFDYQRGYGTKDSGKYDKLEPIGAIGGACFFTSRKIFDKIGYFDPYIFAYFDEYSLAWRAAQLGIKSYYVPNSVIYHVDSHAFKDSSKKTYLLQRNRWYCLLTLYSRRTFYRILPGLILIELISIPYFLKQGKLKQKFQAYREIIKNKKLINKKYLELESRKKASDIEIIDKFIFKPEYRSQKNDLIRRKMFNRILNTLEKLSRLVL